MKFNSSYLLTLVFLRPVFSTPFLVHPYDPWPGAEMLMERMTKFDDLIDTRTVKPNQRGDINFFIPLDYDETEQGRQYERFWNEVATPRQKQMYEFLEDSSNSFDDINATYALSQIHLYSYYGIPHNKSLAFYFTNRYNELTGNTNPHTVFQQAVMYATGLFGTIPPDPARALLLYQQAASLGSLQAKQALAYKYYSGINVPRDSNKALLLYRELADDLKRRYTDEEWDYRFPFIESFNVRLADFEDGLLPPGLRTVSLSTNRKKSARPDITSSVLTKINGGHVVLRFGNMDSSNVFAVDDDSESDDQLVDIYYTALDYYRGTYTASRDVEKARLLLEATYAEYELTFDRRFMDSLQVFFYGKCLDLLGHIYFTGEGIAGGPNIEVAEKFLRRSIEVIEESSSVRSAANLDLGLIYQYYYKNDTQAIECYRKVIGKSINNGIVEFQLARLSEKNPNLEIGDSFGLMQAAFVKGYVPAIYEFAKMTEQGAKNRFNGENTALTYKMFVEENEQFVAPYLKTAFNELLLGNTEGALWAYAMAAEQGFEMAQANAGYLLYQSTYKVEDPPRVTPERKLMAISYYTRASKQDNPDSGVMAGDIYYNMGNYKKAFFFYQSSALKYSPQAIWNLGYMYEYGLGVERDFEMARKYYDQALEVSSRLQLAVKLNILKLNIKSLLLRLIGTLPITTWGVSGKLNTLLRSAAKIRGRLMGTNRYTYPYGVVGRAPHRVTVESGGSSPEVSSNVFEGESGGFIQSLGFHPEDLLTLMFLFVIFFGTFFLRNFAGRMRWNVRINGMLIQPAQDADGAAQPPQDANNNNRAEENGFGGNFNVQIFAI